MAPQIASAIPASMAAKAQNTTIASDIAESLRNLPAGNKLSVRVITTADHQVDSLTPQRRFSHFHSSSTMSRRTLIFVSQGECLVAGLEAHEFTSISIQVSSAQNTSSSVAVDVCIEKVDTSGELSIRMPLVSALIAGYMRSLRRYRAPLGIDAVGVHLFARAQPEYLFAKSQGNPGKRILDDLALIKWWQGTLQSGLAYAMISDNSTASSLTAIANCIVPGTSVGEAPWFLGPQSGIRVSEADKAIEQPATGMMTKCDPADTALSACSKAHHTVQWKWGLPYDDTARAHDCVLQFPDDPMTRLLSEPHSGAWSVHTLLEMLSVSEECGSGRRTAYFSATLPLRAHLSCASADTDGTAEQGRLSFDDYDRVLVALFDRDMDFSSSASALASSRRFTEYIDTQLGIAYVAVDTTGAAVAPRHSETKAKEAPKVNDLTMSIRKKRKVAE
ncbi:hypothetical protein LPJ66_007089 [Kickxella alabastrina]|uniref:Uncharacterized protein n=1 Tax=Kickxella alabastrina TaxID=61397 RepID=A0ACC1IDK7_9FUNG|nr:hypothetical protein LPJ66_007089 [Kickxella alabastrina]